jgi:hypothetical protein
MGLAELFVPYRGQGENPVHETRFVAYRKRCKVVVQAKNETRKYKWINLKLS